MQLRQLAAALGAALALALPATAQTDPPAAVLAKWGLLGTWAVSCTTPPSRTNVYSHYETSGSGGAVLRREFGPAPDGDRSPIDAAEIRADGMLAVTINFPSLNQVRTNVFVKAGDAAMRAWENRAADGSYTVRDGKFVHNGAPTLAQTRCR